MVTCAQPHPPGRSCPGCFLTYSTFLATWHSSHPWPVSVQVPYKYDLSLFCPMNAVAYDHPGGRERESGQARRCGAPCCPCVTRRNAQALICLNSCAAFDMMLLEALRAWLYASVPPSGFTRQRTHPSNPLHFTSLTTRAVHSLLLLRLPNFRSHPTPPQTPPSSRCSRCRPPHQVRAEPLCGPPHPARASCLHS